MERLDGIAVLVVDDHGDTLELLAALLRDEGADVRDAPHASEAFAALDGWTPHVIILDIAQPEEDGCALLKRMRAREGLRSVASIACSGRSFARDVARALDAGFDKYIVKPVSFDDVVEAIAELAAPARIESPMSGVRHTMPPGALVDTR
jgi:two-component system CheB/CheR fusion protein